MDNRQSDYDIVNTFETVPVFEDDKRMRAYPLFSFDPIRSVEVFLIEFEPECRHSSDKHSDGVEEYILVVSGRLQLIINGEEVVLDKGKAVRFRADVHHEYNNPYSEQCTVYNIIFYPG